MAVPKPFGERPLIISVIGIDGVLCNTAVDCPATGGLYLRSDICRNPIREISIRANATFDVSPFTAASSNARKQITLYKDNWCLHTTGINIT
jgi:hypothetical protein